MYIMHHFFLPFLSLKFRYAYYTQKLNINFLFGYFHPYIRDNMTKCKLYLWPKLTNVYETLVFYINTK